jgi:hypothetical protein
VPPPCATATTITLHPVRCAIINGGEWSRGVQSRGRHEFAIGLVILAHLLFFHEVGDDDDVAVIGQPKKTVVRGVASSSSEDRSTTGNPLEDSLCSYIAYGGPWDEPSGEEVGGGEDKDGDEGGVDVSLDEGDEALTYTLERLIPLLTTMEVEWRKWGTLRKEEVEKSKM